MVLAELAVQTTGKPIRLQVGYLRNPDAIDLEGVTNWCVAHKGMIDAVPGSGA